MVDNRGHLLFLLYNNFIMLLYNVGYPTLNKYENSLIQISSKNVEGFRFKGF